MLGHHIAFHHHVVYIDFNTFAQLWFKHSCHHLLIGRPRIFQKKWHQFVVVVSNGSEKSCPFFIVQG